MEKTQTAIRFGLITGLTYVIFKLILYIIDPALYGSFWNMLPFLVVLALVVYAGIYRRKELGGFIDFKEAFKTMFIVFVVSEVMWEIFNYLLYNMIDPGLSQFMRELSIEKTRTGMENWGASEEQIEQTMERLKQQDFTLTLKKLVIGTGIWLLVGAIYALIVAAIIKKKPPEDESLDTEQTNA